MHHVSRLNTLYYLLAKPLTPLDSGDNVSIRSAASAAKRKGFGAKRLEHIDEGGEEEEKKTENEEAL